MAISTMVCLNTSPEDKGIKTRSRFGDDAQIDGLNTSPEDKGIKTLGCLAALGRGGPEHQP